ELLRLDLDLRAVSGAVDLRGTGRKSFESDVHPAVRVSAAVLEERGPTVGGHQHDVEVAVAVEVDGLRIDRGRECADAPPRESAGPVAPEHDRRTSRSREQEVQKTVVVEVGEHRLQIGST